MTPHTKRKLYLRKRHVFVIEKYIEDAKQGQKLPPDLVESIMKGSGSCKRRVTEDFVQNVSI